MWFLWLKGRLSVTLPLSKVDLESNLVGGVIDFDVSRIKGVRFYQDLKEGRQIGLRDFVIGIGV